MSNRFSSRASCPRRAASLFLLASLAATAPLLGGCGMDLQIGDGSSGRKGGSSPLNPCAVTIDPVDTTILRLESLSELEDKTTYYLAKQP
ncbi:hypothetical protein [Sorangium sp. So ce542]|uniref:hypothetical protein n=1 Tax=Sorangium sp. So ce542 TaxID=3133316 RepID=UPI003F61187E